MIPASKWAVWVFLPVLLALLMAAIVGLPLFQDGSSYLLEMLISHSAIRHGRISALLFQSPTILLIKVFHRVGMDSLAALPFVRLAFNLNYALSPLVSLFLSWLVVRKKREHLLIWVVMILLFVNLVNFSWMSELLISIQLTCPLLLALLQDPRDKIYWGLLILLLPFTFFLHPLVFTLYLVLAVASAFTAYKKPAYRKSAALSMVIFLLAAVTRGIYSFFNLSVYEVSFASAGEVSNYFVISRVENVLFLVVAAQLAVLLVLSPSMIRSKARIADAVYWFISVQASLLIMFAAQLLLRGRSSPIVVLASVGVVLLIYFWYTRHSSTAETMQRLSISYVFLAISASSLLLAQYALSERIFTLKMGSDLIVVLFIISMAVLDSVREPADHEYAWRFRLISAFSIIFLGVMLSKSVMWQTSILRLKQDLRQTEGMCVEVTQPAYQWLQSPPYTILNNWAVSSLAVVIQDQQPRKLLLAQTDCQLFDESGMIQIDPWSRIPKENIVPPIP